MLVALDSLLWRSRGTKGRVRAVPGAPPAAAEGMDGPDDARRNLRWGGIGDILVSYHLKIAKQDLYYLIQHSSGMFLTLKIMHRV